MFSVPFAWQAKAASCSGCSTCIFPPFAWASHRLMQDALHHHHHHKLWNEFFSQKWVIFNEGSSMSLTYNRMSFNHLRFLRWWFLKIWHTNTGGSVQNAACCCCCWAHCLLDTEPHPMSLLRSKPLYRQWGYLTGKCGQDWSPRTSSYTCLLISAIKGNGNYSQESVPQKQSYVSTQK